MERWDGDACERVRMISPIGGTVTSATNRMAGQLTSAGVRIQAFTGTSVWSRPGQAPA
jgi:hypothetical protein